MMIHGVASDAEYFKDSASILCTSCKMITYDRNGHSRSIPLPDADFSVRGETEDALGVLSLAGEEKAAIVGVSAGSLPALELALACPERVSRLILFEPAFCFTEESISQIEDFIRTIRGMADEGKTARALLSFVDRIGGLDPDSPPVSEEQQLANYENFLFYLDCQLKHLPYGPEYIDKLTRLTVPCHILVGDKDPEGLFHRAALETAELLGIRPVYVSGYHNYPKDHPEEFAERIRSFI